MVEWVLSAIKTICYLFDCVLKRFRNRIWLVYTYDFSISTDFSSGTDLSNGTHLSNGSDFWTGYFI